MEMFNGWTQGVFRGPSTQNGPKQPQNYLNIFILSRFIKKWSFIVPSIPYILYQFMFVHALLKLWMFVSRFAEDLFVFMSSS